MSDVGSAVTDRRHSGKRYEGKPRRAIVSI
jgi:hypothetical protein